MANQPTHEWNANVFYEVEKSARENITLARRITNSVRSTNPQILSLNNPEADVEALSGLTCTLLDILEEQGVTPEMVARLMGKMAGGRGHAIHRLLPQVKKEIKLELKECRSLTIPRLDQKRSELAAGKRHPKAKGKGKGPKSSREIHIAVEHVEDEVQEVVEAENLTEGVLDATENEKRETLDCASILFVENKEGSLFESGRSEEGDLQGHGAGPMSRQQNRADVDRKERVVREDLGGGDGAGRTAETSKSKKRKRTTSTNNVPKADDQMKK